MLVILMGMASSRVYCDYFMFLIVRKRPAPPAQGACLRWVHLHHVGHCPLFRGVPAAAAAAAAALGVAVSATAAAQAGVRPSMMVIIIVTPALPQTGAVGRGRFSDDAWITWTNNQAVFLSFLFKFGWRW